MRIDRQLRLVAKDPQSPRGTTDVNFAAPARARELSVGGGRIGHAWLGLADPSERAHTRPTRDQAPPRTAPARSSLTRSSMEPIGITERAEPRANPVSGSPLRNPYVRTNYAQHQVRWRIRPSSAR